MTYTYDTWGNITEKKIYAYTTATNPGTPTSTIPYSYTNSTWSDQLTSYNGQTISYDSMGNPTSYRGKTLTWNGKELTGVTGTATYTYDMNGLRTTKTVGGTTTDYFYNNTVLMGLTTGTAYLLFSYDASGQVQAVNFNGTYYYYLRNGQGDIVKLIDGSGNTVVEYAYDSWGKQLSCTGTLATSLGALNPFRYRGYAYDEETQWYYLRSRYYDPETCRFISADVYLSTGQGVIGHNCYAYCLNNPITRKDPNGCVAVCNFLTGCTPPEDEGEETYRSSSWFWRNCYQYATGLPRRMLFRLIFNLGGAYSPGNTLIEDHNKNTFYDKPEQLINDIGYDYGMAFPNKRFTLTKCEPNEELQSGEWIIAYCFSDVNKDFHFLRYDKDYGWTHKKDWFSKPTNKDFSEKVITDPYVAYLGSYKVYYFIKIHVEDR